MSVLATPESSLLLLINPVQRNLGILHNGLADHVSQQFKWLTAAADEALVPRYFAISRDLEEQGQWLSRPCKKGKPRIFCFEPDRSIWSNVELLSAVQRENRSQLYVCGFWLDDVVSAAVLEAQIYGFDTHVVVDLCLAHDRRKHQSCLERMGSYGIVPIHLRNLLYEWMAKSDDAGRRKQLKRLWQQQKSFDVQGASAPRTGLT